MIKPLAWLLVALLALLPGLANSAQVNDDQTTIQQVRILRASNLAVAVPQAGSTTLLNLATRGEIKRIFVQFAVTSQALGGFVIQIVTPGGSAQTIATASGDYTSPTGLLVGTSGDLTGVAAAGTGWFILDTTGVSGVIVKASSGNAGGSTVSIWAGGN